MNVDNILIILFFVSLIFITCKLLINVKETFITDFDDVLDNKCDIQTMGVYKNYDFDTSQCKNDRCPLETCYSLIPDSSTGELKYVSSVYPKQKVYTGNDSFKCISKSNVNKNIYCDVSEPTCNRLGENDYCYDFIDGAFKKNEYKKQWLSNGQCGWVNNTNENVIMDDSYFEECRKTPLDCSKCNIACSSLPAQGVSFLDNYQKYMLNDEGNACILDPNSSCTRCVEGDVKFAYRFISDERRFEPVLYTQKQLGFRCKYFDINGFCYPDGLDDLECSYEENIFLPEDDIELDNCLLKPFRYCCNLDNKGFFEYTKFRPILSSDGTKCVYRTIDDSISREIEYDSPGGFNCPNNEFRLCPNNDTDFRNVIEQKCTPCPEGQYLKDNKQFVPRYACDNLPDCSQNIDYCFENIDDSGTVQIQKYYTQEPQIQYGADQNNAICQQTTPINCQTHCTNIVNDTNGDVYCDNCPDDKRLNIITKQCETPIICNTSVGSLNSCLDKHENTFYSNVVKQDDSFSPCYYSRKNDGYEYKMDVYECESTCPYPYVKDGNKCIIPKCTIEESYDIKINDEFASDRVDIDSTQPKQLYDNIYSFSEDAPYCKINEINKILKLKTQNLDIKKCMFYSDDSDVPNELQDLQTGIYNDDDIVYNESRNGLNGDCPVDCVYNMGTRTTDDVCSGPCSEPHQISYGVKNYTVDVVVPQNRNGLSCDAVGRASINTHGSFNPSTGKFHYTETCVTPRCDIDCVFNYNYCEECTEIDNRPCEFEKTCHLEITTNQYGDNGIACPTNTSSNVSCDVECPMCVTEDIYTDNYGVSTNYNDHVWSGFQNNNSLDHCEKVLTKTKRVTSPNSCKYGGTIYTFGDSISSESKQSLKCPLPACDDSYLQWDTECPPSDDCDSMGTTRVTRTKQSPYDHCEDISETIQCTYDTICTPPEPVSGISYKKINTEGNKITLIMTDLGNDTVDEPFELRIYYDWVHHNYLDNHSEKVRSHPSLIVGSSTGHIVLDMDTLNYDNDNNKYVYNYFTLPAENTHYKIRVVKSYQTYGLIVSDEYLIIDTSTTTPVTTTPVTPTPAATTPVTSTISDEATPPPCDYYYSPNPSPQCPPSDDCSSTGITQITRKQISDYDHCPDISETIQCTYDASCTLRTYTKKIIGVSTMGDYEGFLYVDQSDDFRVKWRKNIGTIFTIQELSSNTFKLQTLMSGNTYNAYVTSSRSNLKFRRNPGDIFVKNGNFNTSFRFIPEDDYTTNSWCKGWDNTVRCISASGDDFRLVNITYEFPNTISTSRGYKLKSKYNKYAKKAENRLLRFNSSGGHIYRFEPYGSSTNLYYVKNSTINKYLNKRSDGYIYHSNSKSQHFKITNVGNKFYLEIPSGPTYKYMHIVNTGYTSIGIISSRSEFYLEEV